jgi:hypothetical protein
MITRKKIKSSRYVAAFAVTLVVFLLGYIVSSEINNIKFNKLTDLEQELRTGSLSNELVLQLIQTDQCESINVSSYTSELSTYGKRLTYLESLYAYSSQKIMDLKIYYTLLEIRHWILAKEINNRCNENITLVLYFYTNYGCTDCEDQGLVLTNVHNNYPFFNIYSFEYALNNPAIDYLKKRYNIQQNRLPTIIINDKVYYGFISKKDLIEIMDLETKLAENKKRYPDLYK